MIKFPMLLLHKLQWCICAYVLIHCIAHLASLETNLATVVELPNDISYVINELIHLFNSGISRYCDFGIFRI